MSVLSDLPLFCVCIYIYVYSCMYMFHSIFSHLHMINNQIHMCACINLDREIDEKMGRSAVKIKIPEFIFVLMSTWM